MEQRQVKPVPAGFHSLTPSLTVKDAAGAIEFYKRAFGAVELNRAMAPDGKSIWHAELQIGDSRFMLNDEFPESGGHAPADSGAMGFSLLMVTSIPLFQKPGLHGKAWFDKSSNYAINAQVCDVLVYIVASEMSFRL